MTLREIKTPLHRLAQFELSPLICDLETPRFQSLSTCREMRINDVIKLIDENTVPAIIFQGRTVSYKVELAWNGAIRPVLCHMFHYNPIEIF
jgi:hypothetical protein